MTKRSISIIAAAALAMAAAAQTDDEYRMEIGAGAGLTAYQGDFNGSIFKGMQPSGSIIARRIINPYMALRLGAMFGKLKGGSDASQTFYPDYADGTAYSFSRSLIDVSLTYEYNFWPYGTGFDYRGAKRVTPFVFGGIGATSASGGTGKSAFTANIPIGIGAKWKVATRLNLGIEWAAHFSLSDNLDGVADPYKVASSGMFKNTDCYTTLQLTLTYSFMAKCKTCNNDR